MTDQVFTYGKKVDKFVFYLLLFCFLICVAPVFFIGGSALWILLFINIITYGGIYWLYEKTDTMIIENKLVHGSGPIKWEIKISDIEKIRIKGKSLINHGTWSSDKMDIVYREKTYAKTLSIAPLQKEALIEKLVSLNSNIEVI